VIQEFEEDEVTLAIKLVPKKEEKIELTVNLKDDNKNPLKGVNISLEVSGEGVGVGISDKDGIFKIALSPDLEGKTINYDAELAGFVLASGALLLKKETSHEITMKKITMKKPPAPPSNRKWLKIAAVVAGIVIVILAVMIILSSSSSSIYVTSSPSGASVYLDGSYKGKTPKTITGVSAGSHTIKLSKSGYKDYTRTRSVKAGKRTIINANLRQATGSIDVTSTPSGASVYLDGSPKGTTPKTITGVSAGSHTFKLSKSGYKDYTGTTSIKAGETKRINANLRQATGSISVASSPSGAYVYLDGYPKGTTPKTITGVSAGAHTIKLSKSGYKDYTRTRSVKAGETISINANLLQAIGSISVTSTPSGASVYLDGSPKGKTPKTITGVSAGAHTIKLSKSGYNDDTRKISVKTGKTFSINANLRQATGSISVYSTPSGASVYLDGSYKGTTPKTITGVSAGAHTIKLVKSGYNDEVRNLLSVKAGKTFSIYVDLLQASGSIFVYSTPSGASVYLDGSPKGMTPKTLRGVPAGSHTIKLSKSGYRDDTRKISVKAGETKHFNAILIQL
jgi:hypothetical protein